jgi:hypothetical protein
MTGDLVAAERTVAMLIELANRLNAALWIIVGRCLEGKLLIQRGEFSKGLDLLRTTLNNCERTGRTICYPEFLGAIAEGLAGLGRLTEALATVDQALTWADWGGEC